MFTIILVSSARTGLRAIIASSGIGRRQPRNAFTKMGACSSVKTSEGKGIIRGLISEPPRKLSCTKKEGEASEIGIAKLWSIPLTNTGSGITPALGAKGLNVAILEGRIILA